MKISFRKFLARLGCTVMLTTVLAGHVRAEEPAKVVAKPVKKPNVLVPGTGVHLTQVGDTFEEKEWEWTPYLPKSSENIDKAQRVPGGVSKNGRFYEGIMRGQPDVVKRVETPAGGLEGSTGALLLMSRDTGVPGWPSHQMQQDDFIVDVESRLGGAIPVSQNPSFVTRVFLPPIEKWERRSGPHFAVRAAVDTMAYTHESKYKQWGREIYYPGMFVELQRKGDNGLKYDTASIRVRANHYGGDFQGPQITQTGWWTFGMSFSADGMIHFFAKPGIEDITADDHISSQYPYGYHCQRFKTFFFNVCSADDGRTWSTPWVIDDPSMYYIQLPETARRSR